MEAASTSKTGRKQSEAERCAACDRLETEVRKRTEALAATNDQLRAEIEARRRCEEALRAALAEKDVLLKEVHHRMKNNMAVIHNLLSLQARRTDDPKAVQILRDSQNRVRSMTLIHERFFPTCDVTRIDIGDYIRALTKELFHAYRVEPEAVTLSIAADNVALELDTAIPCGLLINELVTNCLKHAFPNGRSGHISVELRTEKDTFTLVVSDDGTGFDAPLEQARTSTLGMQLIALLVEQLRGTIIFQCEGGTRVAITGNMRR
jgi:two-component sensor histidine kinase